jgi:hypothetical protein
MDTGGMNTGGVNCKRPAIWACASLGVILSATACLSYDANGFVSFGVGNRSCDQYVADAHEPQRGFVYETWLSGYLTAFNAYNLGIADILAGTDLDRAVSRLKHYCSEHPTAVVHVATEKLIRFMQER